MIFSRKFYSYVHTQFFKKYCPTERMLGEKIVLLKVIAAKKNCPTGRNST